VKEAKLFWEAGARRSKSTVNESVESGSLNDGEGISEIKGRHQRKPRKRKTPFREESLKERKKITNRTNMVKNTFKKDCCVQRET
jgi:hypothetical protein